LIIDFDSTWNSSCRCCLGLPLGLTDNPQVRILVNQQVSQTEPNCILSPALAILAYLTQFPCPALTADLSSTKVFCQLPLGVHSWSGLVPPIGSPRKVPSCTCNNYCIEFCKQAIDLDEVGEVNIFAINQLEVMRMILASWDAVSSSSIEHCWDHTGIQPPKTKAPINLEIPSVDTLKLQAQSILRTWASSSQLLPQVI
jgi:hypothetical protein